MKGEVCRLEARCRTSENSGKQSFLMCFLSSSDQAKHLIVAPTLQQQQTKECSFLKTNTSSDPSKHRHHGN